MDYSSIKTGLERFVERYDSQTYIGSYRETSRSSLLNDGLSTRANSLWKMAEYVVAKFDNTNNLIDQYIKGWKQLASGSNNQYLLLEEGKDSWGMYDSQGKRLGGEDYIKDYFLRQERRKINLGQNSKFSSVLSPYPFQQIFYGAPGTGKSHKIKNDEKVKEANEKNLVFRTTFHPDSDYSTFVGAYKPTIKPVADKYKAVAGKDEEITYSFVPQAFLQAYVAAWDNPEENVYLVIEEINRGNCAQIFGDLFQLLDRDCEGFSEYPIMADNDLKKYLNGKDESGHDILTNKDGIKDGKLRLPQNLYIWATMNTSDQSLFPIDSAFKRRWDWVYVPIDTAKETWYIKVGEDYYSWTQFLNKVNDKLLTDETAEDKHLGFYFCKAQNNVISQDTFVAKVLFYLWNDVFKVYGIPSDIGSSKDWPYHKFYQTNGEVDEEKVKELMKKLDIKPEGSNENNEEEAEDQ